VPPNIPRRPAVTARAMNFERNVFTTCESTRTSLLVRLRRTRLRTSVLSSIHALGTARRT
jgi:hypothetical protein